jgi:hypothetical protein
MKLGFGSVSSVKIHGLVRQISGSVNHYRKPLYYRSGQLLCVAKYELPTSAKEENYGLSHGLVYRVVKQSAEEEGVV